MNPVTRRPNKAPGPLSAATLAAATMVTLGPSAAAATASLISGTFVGQDGSSASGQTVTVTAWPTGLTATEASRSDGVNPDC